MHHYEKILTYLVILISFSSCKEKIDKTKKIEFPEKIIKNIQIESESKIVTNPELINENNCDVVQLIKFDSIIDNRKRIYGQDIFMFFADMNPACNSNVEYNELENEIVFKILKSEPQDFVLLLDGQTEENIDYVLSIVENPINDEIDLNNALSRIIELKNNEIKTKNRVIKSLNIAIEKYK